MTLARVNHGRWLADCPAPACAGAELVRLTGPFACGTCGVVADVAWPDDVAGITTALEVRPDPATRNWWPAGHPAVPPETPAGQSVEDLELETLTHLAGAC